jgi:tRNA-dihydrouridine synthase
MTSTAPPQATEYDSALSGRSCEKNLECLTRAVSYFKNTRQWEIAEDAIQNLAEYLFELRRYSDSAGWPAEDHEAVGLAEDHASALMTKLGNDERTKAEFNTYLRRLTNQLEIIIMRLDKCRKGHFTE